MMVTWFANFPDAVHSFLDSRDHLTYLLELFSSSSETVFTRGMSAILLGECVLFNKSDDSWRDAFMVVDAISQKIGLTSCFLKFDEIQKSFPFLSAKALQQCKPLARSSAASMSEIEDVEENNLINLKHDEDPVLISVFDAPFVNLVKRLEFEIRKSIVDVYSHPKSKVAVVPVEMEQMNGESNEDYIKRLKSFVEKQCKFLLANGPELLGFVAQVFMLLNCGFVFTSHIPR
ncbi:Golgin candidate [Thalictrum thalictroides]|uniref:Golgin candidate n=1 Tax=Thalictrum thalictroides TaxID=46969 RepID=A0A7J6WW69_THATH|nr:Golgin candidate [Thalictrum thalictroides]